MRNLNKWQEKTRIREPVSKFKVNQPGKRQRIDPKPMASTPLQQSRTAGNAARKQLEPHLNVQTGTKNKVRGRDQEDDPESSPSQRETLLPQREATIPQKEGTVSEMDASQRETYKQGKEHTPASFPNTNSGRENTDTTGHTNQAAPVNTRDDSRTGRVTRTAKDKLME